MFLDTKITRKIVRPNKKSSFSVFTTTYRARSINWTKILCMTFTPVNCKYSVNVLQVVKLQFSSLEPSQVFYGDTLYTYTIHCVTRVRLYTLCWVLKQSGFSFSQKIKSNFLSAKTFLFRSNFVFNSLFRQFKKRYNFFQQFCLNQIDNLQSVIWNFCL